MIIDDYLELQQKYEKQYGPQTVVLMEVGSFYELYGVNNTDHNISNDNINNAGTGMKRDWCEPELV